MARHTIVLTTLTCSAVCAALLLCPLSACHQPQSSENLLSKARQYQQKGESKTAIIELKNALQKDGNNGQARLLLGEVYIEAGDPVSAEKELRKAKALGVKPSDILPLLGRAMLMMGQFEQVLNEIKLDAASPDQMAVVAVRANAYFGLGAVGQAKELFELVLKKQANLSDLSDALLGLARIAVSQQQFDHAGELIERALAGQPGNIESLRLKGDLLRMRGKNEAALPVYRQILALRPDHSFARIDIANLYIQAGQFAAARTELDAARKRAPNSLMLLNTQALLDFREGKYKSALDAVQQVLRAAPDHMPGILLMGAVQLALGSQDQAEQYLRRFLEANPRHLYASKMLASIELGKGKPDLVVDMILPLLQDHPDDTELLALIGEAHMRAQRFGKAAEYFEKASALSPQAASLHTALGVSWLGMGENARAIAELERASSLNAKGSPAGVMLVMTLLRTKDYDKALAAVKTLEQTQPSNPLVYNLKGGVYLAKQDLKLASSSFEQALKVDPTYMPAMENLAQIDLAEKKPEQARRRYEAALAKDQKNISLMTALAKLAAAQGNKGEALRWLERASKDDALQPSMLLSGFYLQTGETQKALSLAQTLQTNNPSNPEVLALLAQIEYSSGNRAAALESYTKLALLQPDSADLQMRVANIELLQKDFSGAMQSVKKALKLKPGLLEAQVTQVFILLASNNYGEAMALAQSLQKQRPDMATGFKLEGDIWMAQKRPLPALKLYEQAFGMNKIAPLLIQIHQALLLVNRSQEADQRIGAWLRDKPQDLSTRLYWAASSLERKQYKPAILQYELIVQQDPKNVIALNDLAWAYQQEKDGHALPTAEQAYRLAPTNPAVLDTLAWILTEQGQPERALPLARKAASLAANSSEIAYHLGIALMKTGDKKAAHAQFEQILATNKDFLHRAEVQTLLAQP